MINLWTDKDVEAHWDSVANIYIRENEKVKKAHDQRFSESVGYLDLKNNVKVLNITSRDAGANRYIRESGANVEVIHAEISAQLINEAKKLNPDINQMKLDNYSKLPFPDHTFDRILSLETIEHVAEPINFLQELHRISKPGARLVLSCPPATSEIPYRIYSFLFGGHGEGPHKFPSSRKVKTWLKQTRWKLLIHKGTVLMPVGPELLQSLGEKIIQRLQNTFLSELGIRQFYICERT
jgi:ubiquinone/menaquinone biosynthesis C-methylase UbiE